MEAFFLKAGNNIENDIKELCMPLIKGAKAKTKQGISANIRAERNAGKPEAQSIAIAMSEAGKSKKKKKK